MSSLPQANWPTELDIEVEDFDGLFYKSVPTQLLANSLIKKDIWRTIDDLKLGINLHDKVLTLKFNKIQVKWLNLLSKLYVLVRSKQNLSPRYLRAEISYLVRFSRFIQQNTILRVEQLSDQFFDDFDVYLKSFSLSDGSKSHQYMTLINFFDLCRLEGWLDVNTYWFRGRWKGSPPNNSQIDYIPESVWKQLDENLDYLPEPLQRMVLIIRATGLRIGELLNLPLDCLRKRGNQWRIRFLTEKYKVEDELPICSELVMIIQEQQEFIKDIYGNTYHFLFCGSQTNNKRQYKPCENMMGSGTFNRWLNLLAQERKICDETGEIWHFTSHQFRRTVGTIFDNAGIRSLIIQKYLRHRSPNVQNHYKHLLKKVIGDEYAQLMKKKEYVDITGKVVATHTPNDAITEYMRRRMHQTTTQVGECHRPNIKELCPTVNACNRCNHWLTTLEDLPFLEKDLQRLQQELIVAQKLGLTRNTKELEKDIHHLQNRINGLKEI